MTDKGRKGGKDEMSNKDAGMVTLAKSCRGPLKIYESPLQAGPMRDQGAECMCVPPQSMVEMGIPRY